MALFLSFPQMYALAYGVHQNFIKINILSNTTMQGSSTMVLVGRKVTQIPTVGKTNLQTIFTPGIDYATGPQTMNYVAGAGSVTTISDTVALVSRTQNNHSIIGGAGTADKYLDMYTGCNIVASNTVNILAAHWNLHVTGLGILKKLK
jgi:hypothetical protein